MEDKKSVSQEYINGHLATGREIERAFVECYLKTYGHRAVVWATSKEDMFEHWDVSINGAKIDVKGRVQFGRGTGKQDTYQRIELLNFNGNYGWLCGKAKFIVYELLNSWVIVDRLKLKLFAENYQIDPNIVTSSPKVGCLQRREGRKDLLLWVEMKYILDIAEKVVKKLE